ncbi:unnamed protein product [Protopolystoma xenopodis]|uniref:Uncharacterized protein n=1 Tax=Protopolystoma xenopodis TaxID=117903 RepID=A0A3S4ZGG5_9PLAT|nr:unnamed protein product [Protopolystoma xenopodis]
MMMTKNAHRLLFNRHRALYKLPKSKVSTTKSSILDDFITKFIYEAIQGHSLPCPNLMRLLSLSRDDSAAFQASPSVSTEENLFHDLCCTITAPNSQLYRIMSSEPCISAPRTLNLACRTISFDEQLSSELHSLPISDPKLVASEAVESDTDQIHEIRSTLMEEAQDKTMRDIEIVMQTIYHEALENQLTEAEAAEKALAVQDELIMIWQMLQTRLAPDYLDYLKRRRKNFHLRIESLDSLDAEAVEDRVQEEGSDSSTKRHPDAERRLQRASWRHRKRLRLDQYERERRQFLKTAMAYYNRYSDFFEQQEQESEESDDPNESIVSQTHVELLDTSPTEEIVSPPSLRKSSSAGPDPGSKEPPDMEISAPHGSKQLASSQWTSALDFLMHALRLVTDYSELELEMIHKNFELILRQTHRHPQLKHFLHQMAPVPPAWETLACRLTSFTADQTASQDSLFHNDPDGARLKDFFAFLQTEVIRCYTPPELHGQSILDGQAQALSRQLVKMLHRLAKVYWLYDLPAIRLSTRCGPSQLAKVTNAASLRVVGSGQTDRLYRSEGEGGTEMVRQMEKIRHRAFPTRLLLFKPRTTVKKLVMRARFPSPRDPPTTPDSLGLQTGSPRPRSSTDGLWEEVSRPTPVCPTLMVGPDTNQLAQNIPVGDRRIQATWHGQTEKSITRGQVTCHLPVIPTIFSDGLNVQSHRPTRDLVQRQLKWPLVRARVKRPLFWPVESKESGPVCDNVTSERISLIFTAA